MRTPGPTIPTIFLLLAASVPAQLVLELEGRTLELSDESELVAASREKVALITLVPGTRPADLEQAEILPLGGQLHLLRLEDHRRWPDLIRQGLVQSVNRIRPADRLSTRVRQVVTGEAWPEHARGESGGVRLSVRILAPPVDEDSLRRKLSALGGVAPEDHLRFGGMLLVELPRERILDLAGLPEVVRVELADPPRGVRNLHAQELASVDLVQAPPYGLDGTGVVVGVWDSARAANHDDYSGRVTNEEAGSQSNHTTHVTGTILGDGTNLPAAEGMATGATAHIYDFDGDVALEMNTAVTSHGISAASNSWGLVVGWYWTGFGWAMGGSSSLFGEYTAAQSGAMDQVAESNPDLLIVWAAGNDRSDGPAGSEDGTLAGDGERYDNTGPYGIAKNVLAIGALQDDGETPTGFSSFGPADDGRIKPDLMANGQSLLSTQPGNRYGYASGTSMSCPTVSGAVLDLVQAFQNATQGASPASHLLRAVLVCSAADLHLPGPDARTGFGALDLRRAVDGIHKHFTPALEHIQIGSVTSGQVIDRSFTVPTGTGQLQVALCWTDPAGTGASASPLVNDLDLALVEPITGTLHHPWKLDAANPQLAATQGANRVDVLEVATVEDPVPGFWILRVTGFAVTGSQPFAVFSHTNLSSDPFVRRLGGLITDCGVPAGGVSVRLDGVPSDEVVTGSDGRYVFQVPDGVYTVTPQGEGQWFTPFQHVVVLAGADSLDNDATMTTNGIVVGECRYEKDEVPDLAIPDDDLTGVVSALTVPDSFILDDLRVRVRIHHTFRGDLDIVLRAPGGAPFAQLRVPDGRDGGDDIIGTFDTELTPVDPLSVFNGIDAQGTWELAVADVFAPDTGAILEWELILDCPPATPPEITTMVLPDAGLGSAYGVSLQASGGSPPLVWDHLAGTLPPGLTLGATGLLGGTPAADGLFSFTVRVTDVQGLCDTQVLDLTVQAGPIVSGICGDCDNNYFVNIVDALHAARIDSLLATPEPGTVPQCNVNGSALGGVSILDSLTIARFIVGLVPTLACAP